MTAEITALPNQVASHLMGAVQFAFSWPGVVYGVSKAALDTATVMVESALVPAAVGIVGTTIGGFGIRVVNAALSLGVANSYNASHTAGTSRPWSAIAVGGVGAGGSAGGSF